MGFVTTVYECGTQVPTIELGAGDVCIGATVSADGMAGVVFSRVAAGEIGRDIPPPDGATVTDLGAAFQILSTSKESLLVLRAAVESAIKHFDDNAESQGGE